VPYSVFHAGNDRKHSRRTGVVSLDVGEGVGQIL
jgi:hypothetical protein